MAFPGSERGSESSAAGMMPGTVPVRISPGDLIDRITILEIKLRRMHDPGVLGQIREQLAHLWTVRNAYIPASETVSALTSDLLALNEELWDIEDVLRRHESAGRFGDDFIQAAVRVRRTNDLRCVCKRNIDVFLGSAFREEKLYAGRPLGAPSGLP